MRRFVATTSQQGPVPAPAGTCRSKRLQLRRVPARLLAAHLQSSNYPGATAPGTGARHFPNSEDDQGTAATQLKKERQEKFEMKRTDDYYKDFPGLVRSSMPLLWSPHSSLRKAGPQEPLGKLEQKEDDAGPTTGHRRMPDPVDAEGRDRPRLPSHTDNIEELRREVQSRKGSL